MTPRKRLRYASDAVKIGRRKATPCACGNQERRMRIPMRLPAARDGGVWSMRCRARAASLGTRTVDHKEVDPAADDHLLSKRVAGNDDGKGGGARGADRRRDHHGARRVGAR